MKEWGDCDMEEKGGRREKEEISRKQENEDLW